MSKIYIIATPIGNLKDFSFRAAEALKEADFVLCEDTRKTKILLDFYKIQKPAISYHQHSKTKKTEHILSLLKGGKNLALVSDAGTPGISDPGNNLIEEILIRLGEETAIIPIPGASAITAIASIAGFSMDKFLFLGFPPRKNKRQKFFREIIESKCPVIVYESPHRILKTLHDLAVLDKNLELVVGRELTKKFESIYRGKIDKIIQKLEKNKTMGEFVVIIKNIKK